jgi:hypothetical protein
MKIDTKSKVAARTVEQASQALKKSVQSLDELNPELQEKVIQAIDNTKVTGVEIPDTPVYRWAVLSLAFVSCGIVLGSLVITYVADSPTEVPEFLRTTLATTIGALAGMLIPSAKSE